MYLNFEKSRNEALQNQRKKFCVSAINQASIIFSDLFRLEFIEELSKYRKVDLAGKYRNNVGGLIKNKIEFF